MPREIPDVPKGWKPPQPGSGRSYEIELVTPMFSGGVSTRVNDPSFPIRPTSIRGHLQFWWRAAVGAQYATRQELREEQTKVWGGVVGDNAQASPVQVRVDDVQASDPVPCAEIVWDPKASKGKGNWRTNWFPPFRVKSHPMDDSLPYALFPFQGKPENQKKQEPRLEPASCIHHAKFRLTVICPDNLWPQVEPALWAWVNFGGFGSRTRRGCGAIICKALAPKDADDLKAMWLRHMPALFPLREWPTMAESVSVRTVEQPADGIPVWDWLIGRFRHFRQGEGLGRNPRQQGSNRPGRSHYSEPETIRRVTGRRIARHARLPRIPDDAFPRAELGLPIVFHFQDEQNGEPPDTVLYPDNDSEGKRRERMASPLILKPLALQSGKAVPLILRLKTPALTGVDLRRGDTSLSLPPTTVIRDPRLSGYPNSPLAGSPNGSAIEAFIDFARTEGFTEVTR